MVCCVTGNRPKKFPFKREKGNDKFDLYKTRLDYEIELLIKYGYDEFISGMAEGADLDFAESVIRYRNNGSYITFEAALPYPLKKTNKKYGYNIKKIILLNSADKETVISKNYYRGCMQKRNEYMVDKSNLVLAIWNGDKSGGTWNTIKYAIKKGKNIRYIMLNENNWHWDEELEEML
ncbi:MAG: DUF1273 family protein [Clostridia bacterium]|nr:DUF1273 family protein [Clostridia bacterium]